MEPFKIGIAGLGTVGAGVVKILQQNADAVAARAGRPIEIISVTAGNKNKDRGVDLSNYDWAETLDDMAKDDRLDCIVEAIGGSEGPVKDFVEKSLASAKHVVTANKALLAHHGYEFAKLADDNNVGLAYEAAVAGGIPIIKAIREGLAANQFNSVYGILNGTCNYILTEMRETGRSFDDVLADAQKMGYAEADPTFDVDGIDAAHKLVLLGALAFGVRPDFDALKPTGVRNISIDDIHFAEEFGFRIKLIGSAKHHEGTYSQSLDPCFVPKSSAIGNVEGVFNAVLTDGDFVDQTMLQGRGAGEGPTASSIVADIIDFARGNVVPAFTIPAEQLKEISWATTSDQQSAYYLRIVVKDEAGALSDVTAALKDHNISIDQVVQRSAQDGRSNIALITHLIDAQTVEKALDSVNSLGCILDKATCLRVEDI